MKYRLIQIETNLLNSDTEIMKAFAEQFQDPQARQDLMDLILNDYWVALEKIEELTESSVEERRIAKLQNVELRNDALRILHQIQLDYLSKWRSLMPSESEESNQYLLQLLLLVNALSGGLKGTG